MTALAPSLAPPVKGDGGTASARAALAWGDRMPAWIEVLADACDQSSQAKVATRLAVSAALVSLVLNARYGGDLAGIEQRVRGAFMGVSAACPVLGEIPIDECLGHQARTYSPTNHQRIAVYRACRAGCPSSKIKEV
jgi:hypothetical protein